MKKQKAILLAVLALSVAVVAGCSNEEQARAEGESQVLTVEAKPGSVQVRVEGPAVVEPYRQQTIRAQIEGIVLEARVEGDGVAAGDLLVGFDSTDQQKAVRQAELALTQARLNRDRAAAVVEKGQEDLQAKQALVGSGAVPRDQLTEAQDALATARYGLQSAEVSLSQAALALETARRDLEATMIRAPFTGVVLSGSLNPGDLVSKGAPLMDLADLSRVRLKAEVDEFDISRVAIGQAATVSSEALGEDTPRGKVEAISPAAEVVNNISIFKVTTVLENEEGKLRPGMSADLSILISSDKGLVVPSKAVSTVRTRSYIKVLQDGEIETKRVTIGADDGVNVAVLEGLEEGELVVLPSAAGLTLVGGESTTGSSVIPISVPGVRTQ